jgi:exodeoxyribonuclease V alpha subunit
MSNSTILDNPEFTDIDRHFSNFIGDFGEGELAVIAAAILSRNIRRGHSCLDLGSGPADFDEKLDFRWPKLDAWRKALAKSRAVGSPDDGRPLVLDKTGRIYLRRYWEYERSLAEQILERCDGTAPRGPKSDDLQQLAIETALVRRFVVISGGPGTGKTTTVLRILERLMSEPGGENLSVALAAPTGKAAARLQETLRAGCSGPLQDRLPTASTLHRLLGARNGSVYFRHNASNPLPVDLVVVDEASMVPLTMMSKLFDALPQKARLILLGDRDQLASVEPGSVLGDIAEAASQPGGPLQGSLVVLQKNYRFGNDSSIFALCNAVRDGETDRAFEILNSGKRPDLGTQNVPSPKELSAALRPQIVAGYSSYLRASDPAEALKEFQKFRVLCALRVGPYGVESVNRQIEEILRTEGLISGPPDACPGMPILITRNDYELRLFNGDIGILLPDPTGSLLAWFIGEDGSVRQIPPARLPEHEPAFAMTVHKSQGSEFENVLVLLPDKESPALTRELVYTALTRARKRVEVWFQESVLRAAIARQVRRDSGLKQRIESSTRFLQK